MLPNTDSSYLSIFSYLYTFGTATLQIFLLFKRDLNQSKHIKHSFVFLRVIATCSSSIIETDEARGKIVAGHSIANEKYLNKRTKVIIKWNVDFEI